MHYKTLQKDKNTLPSQRHKTKDLNINRSILNSGKARNASHMAHSLQVHTQQARQITCADLGQWQI